MQTKLQSAVEAITNTIISFIVGVLSNYYILPLVGLPASMKQATWLTAAFTVISLIRQYLLRRLFNRIHAT